MVALPQPMRGTNMVEEQSPSLLCWLIYRHTSNAGRCFLSKSCLSDVFLRHPGPEHISRVHMEAALLQF